MPKATYNMAGWATAAITRLKEGNVVIMRPRGNSMKGKVDSGEIVHLVPIGDRVLEKGDIVLCICRGYQYFHLIKAVRGNQYLVGGVHSSNGWIHRSSIYGIKEN